MIIEAILNVMFNFLSGLFGLLPDISWDVSTSAFEYFLDIVRVVGYLMPIKTVSTIITLIVALTVFRIIIAVIKTVWDLLPFA